MTKLNSLDGAIQFETDRLVCRRWRESDLDDIYKLYSDPIGARWVADGQPIQHHECVRWLEVTAENYRKRGYGMYGFDEKSTGKFIACAGLIHPDNQVLAEIKYSIQRAHWGKGLATEIVNALLRYAQHEHSLTEVIATVAKENIASQKVLENCGFMFQEELPDPDIPNTSMLLYRHRNLATDVQ